eukprot:761448-Hanusia_phi.AAC.2
MQSTFLLSGSITFECLRSASPSTSSGEISSSPPCPNRPPLPPPRLLYLSSPCIVYSPSSLLLSCSCCPLSKLDPALRRCGSSPDLYNPKDLYGNKDLPVLDQGQPCLSFLNPSAGCLTGENGEEDGEAAAAAAAAAEEEEEEEIADLNCSFYARRAAHALLRAAELAESRGDEESSLPEDAGEGGTWEEDRLEILTGKVCIVTGAGGGIGWEIALLLARRGATVVMACRMGSATAHDEASLTLAGKAAGRIRGKTRNQRVGCQFSLSNFDMSAGKVYVEELDLQRPDSIRAFTDRISSRFGKIHLLVNNAACAPAVRQETEEGIEVQVRRGMSEVDLDSRQFAVNVLACHRLIRLLLPQLGIQLVKRSRGGYRWAGAGCLKFDVLPLPSSTIFSSPGARTPRKLPTCRWVGRSRAEGGSDTRQSKQALRMLTWGWADKLAGEGSEDKLS